MRPGWDRHAIAGQHAGLRSSGRGLQRCARRLASGEAGSRFQQPNRFRQRMEVQTSCCRRRVIARHVNHHVCVGTNEEFERAVADAESHRERIVQDFVHQIVGVADVRLRRVTGIERQRTSAGLHRRDVAGDGRGVGGNRQPFTGAARGLRVWIVGGNRRVRLIAGVGACSGPRVQQAHRPRQRVVHQARTADVQRVDLVAETAVVVRGANSEGGGLRRGRRAGDDVAIQAQACGQRSRLQREGIRTAAAGRRQRLRVIDEGQSVDQRRRGDGDGAAANVEREAGIGRRAAIVRRAHNDGVAAERAGVRDGNHARRIHCRSHGHRRRNAEDAVAVD